MNSKLINDVDEYFKKCISTPSYKCNCCGNRMPEEFAKKYNYKCSLCNGTLIKEGNTKEENRKASSSCEAQYFDN